MQPRGALEPLRGAGGGGGGGGGASARHRSRSPSLKRPVSVGVRGDDGTNEAILVELKNIARFNRMSSAFTGVMALAIVALAVMTPVYVNYRVDPIVQRVNVLSETDLPKIVAGVGDAVKGANATVADLNLRRPMWFTGIDKAFNAFTPRFDGIAANADVLLDKIATQNFTVLMQRVTNVLSAVNTLFYQPLLSNPFVLSDPT